MPGTEDMNNGNGSDVNRIYTDALTAQLGERVTNLNRRQSDLETEMRSGFKQIESSMTSMSSEMRSAVAALSTNLAERNRPQWQAIGVAITFCTVIGGLAYWPINASTARLENAVVLLGEKVVTRQEMDWRQARGQEDRTRMEASIASVREAQVPRAELERVWTSEDQQRAQMQKQIDELKQGQANTYSARDLLLDMRERQDRLERSVYGAARPAP